MAITTNSRRERSIYRYTPEMTPGPSFSHHISIVESASNRRRDSTRKLVIPILFPSSLNLHAEQPISTLNCLTNPNKDNQTSLRQFLPSQNPKHSPFLRLPYELRLEIYTHLLPPQTHKIRSQRPFNGGYYDSVPKHAARTLYPITSHCERTQTSSQANKPKLLLTTYTISTPCFPSSDTDNADTFLHTDILRTCRQMHQEAEGILYGHSDTVFDFGDSIDAVIPFWLDRSAPARKRVRSIHLLGDMGFVKNNMTPHVCSMEWNEIWNFLKRECTGLKSVKLEITIKKAKDLRSRPGPDLQVSNTGAAHTVGGGSDLDIWTTTSTAHDSESSQDGAVPVDENARDGNEKREERYRRWEELWELFGCNSLRGGDMLWDGDINEEAKRELEDWLDVKLDRGCGCDGSDR